MKFEELDDMRWGRIEPLLPPRAKEGRPRANDRAIMNAILFVLITGCRWIDIPRGYAVDSTANRGLRRWEKEGVWKRIVDALIGEGYGNGTIKMKGSRSTAQPWPPEKRELIGHDGHHKKKGTKIHAAVTPSSFPVCIMMGIGNEHESGKLFPLMNGIRVNAPHQRGRLKKRPRRVHADKNYDTFLVRLYLQRRHVYANKPRRSKKKRVGRPSIFDKKALRKTRYTVERFFSWIKPFRRIDTRYDRLADAFMGFVRLVVS